LNRLDNRYYHVTIKGLFFDELGRLLLVQEKTGAWDLPGGRIEHGENFHSTLARECREEMGLECTVLDSQPHWAWSALDGDGIWKVVLCFRITLPHLDFTPSDECVAVAFLAPEDLGERNTVLQMQPLRDLLTTAY
jgi:8-oxo-dGTP pyrophosphatase MutT (NUDIX family)